MLQYHGWSDPQIPPMHSVNYYKSVLEAMGAGKVDGIRIACLWCRRWGIAAEGRGPNEFHAMAVIERWQEGGVAPEQIVAAHVTNNKVDMTRPLCPYPQVAQYKGVGSTNDAGNFVCKVAGK